MEGRTFLKTARRLITDSLWYGAQRNPTSPDIQENAGATDIQPSRALLAVEMNMQVSESQGEKTVINTRGEASSRRIARLIGSAVLVLGAAYAVAIMSAAILTR